MADKILIALDNSEGAWGAVEYAAQAFGKILGVQITLLHILPGLPPQFWDHGHLIEKDAEIKALQRLVDNWEAEQEKQWHSLMQKARGRLKKAGIPDDAVTARFKTKYYDVAEDILDEAETGGFHHIVLGRRGLGKARARLLGSVAHQVAQKARSGAVTIVSNLRPIHKILFPLDLDSDYKPMIPLVQDLARRFQAAILLMYVAPPVTMFPSFYVNINMASFEAEVQLAAGQQMAAIAQNYFKDFPQLETRVALGHPAEEILKAAGEEKVDLIIMGTHGRPGIERLVFGSVAFQVVQAAPCTIVTLHP
jgi:nucleotide-binding universal stress UspA family protein